MTAETVLQPIVLSVDIAVCSALLVLFSIITVKSHCCDRQYSRKQRIFLYLLLASLGASCTNLLILLETEWLGDGLVYLFFWFSQLFNVFFCWAVLHMCCEIFTTLRRTEFHCLRFRFHTVVEEVCILTVTFLLIVVVCYSVGVCVTLSTALQPGVQASHTMVLIVGTVYLLCVKVVPYMFVIFFGWNMLQDLGRQCCCRRYRRHRQLPEIGFQTGIPSTTRTYYTCDDRCRYHENILHV